jgi:hypothetical protein
VTRATGLRATAKAAEHPPEPKVGAPVLDPTRFYGSSCGAWDSFLMTTPPFIIRQHVPEDFAALPDFPAALD